MHGSFGCWVFERCLCRAIEEAALKEFEIDLRKKGVDNYRENAQRALSSNTMVEGGHRFARKQPTEAEVAAAAADEGPQVADSSAPPCRYLHCSNPAHRAVRAFNHVDDLGSEHDGICLRPQEVPEWKRAANAAAAALRVQFYYVDSAGTQQGPHPLAHMQVMAAAPCQLAICGQTRHGHDKLLTVLAAHADVVQRRPAPSR